jgi:Fur family ferric uptake transcriptional regulator
MPTTKDVTALPPDIQSRLEAAGLRRTLLTRAVLGIFLDPARVDLSHPQVLSLLVVRGMSVDRVTLYRLLDRLAACGVLQRRSDAHTRIWRYRLASTEAVVDPIFECDGCHRQYSLADTIGGTEAWSCLFSELARTGHRRLSLHGTCPSCVDGAEASFAGQKGASG